MILKIMQMPVNVLAAYNYNIRCYAIFINIHTYNIIISLCITMVTLIIFMCAIAHTGLGVMNTII